MLGTFAVYYAEPRMPDVAAKELIERAAHVAGIAIERRQLDDHCGGAVGAGIGVDDVDSRQRGEAVGFHQPPREPEPLHAQRMLRTVVELMPLVGIDDRGGHGGQDPLR